MGVTADLRSFADEIGAIETIWIGGDRSRLSPTSDVRTVRAPRGILAFEPDEMIVTCGAGTPLVELDEALAAAGQYANLGQLRHAHGTVGGALAMGCNDHLRLGRGHVRDTLLEAHVVDGRGTLFKGGGPTVKNVSGFDVCRLMVGSRGRLGAIARVTLRTRPRAKAMVWMTVDDTATDRLSIVLESIHRPSSVLWNGSTTHVCLEGHPDDIEEQRVALRRNGLRVSDHDAAPVFDAHPYRWSLTPHEALDLATSDPGSVMVEVGTGIVHHRRPAPGKPIDESVRMIHERLLDAFDPHRRFNPGIGEPWTW